MELNSIVQLVCHVTAGMVIASAWQGLLLAAAIWMCLKLAPTLSASLRFAIWASVFATVLLLPGLYVSRLLSSGPVSPTSPSPSHTIFELDSRWALVIAALWIGLALVQAAVLVRGALRIRSLWNHALAIPTDPAWQPSQSISAMTRSAQVYSSTAVDQPCVIGFWKPRVLIPEWLLAKATPAELRQVVLHEVAHLKRFDDWTNVLQKLSLVLFPLNPALYWIERQLCSTREEACDERVIRETQSPREYATCLANLAEAQMVRRMRATSAALSLGAWEHRSALACRIYKILRGGSRISPMKARLVMAALVLATASGALELGRSGELVAFTYPAVDRAHLANHPSLAQSASPSPKVSYHDVVFHEPAPRARTSFSRDSSSLSDSGAVLKSAKQLLPAHTAHTPAIRRVTAPSTPAVQSWIVVTRWETSAGPQTTVTLIDSVFRISALSAGPSSSGWYVVQL
ncbi:Regulatory sensor-transducer, BlaR1/MecR1 family [Acidisarcina polymorpha]|uniref:Regulatory sensor-transducer, BlaR1/MecR1 family n=1 Tax=Acidisarcina polymorpha TaxID=2211140 RepID=A0A2Z5G0Z7_9BACT|nr:M56 family metallopeptidase [Acidisarcina polymorpha]AXC12831.1 Regulatory sensor-transducer, BlaR1/MecR1 family [Acidisarcina polymorpha]